MSENNGEALDYINEMARSRGYVLRYHKLMADADFEVLQASNGLVSAAYTSKRNLDKATKEPFIEVHIANVVAPPTAPRRLPGGPWQSNFTRTAPGMCMGMRHYSYAGALVALTMFLDDSGFMGEHLAGVET